MNDIWPSILSRHGAKMDDSGHPYFDQPAAVNAASLVPLLAEGSLLVRGVDAAAFLQGQLTNDLDQVTPNRGQPAAYCTAKGRVLATFTVWPHEQGYVLRLPADLAQPIRQRLQKYILRSRVTIEDVSNHVALLGLVSRDSVPFIEKEFGPGLAAPYAVTRGEGFSAMALPGGRVQLSVETESASSRWDRLVAAGFVPAAQPQWDLMAIEAGVASVHLATSEQFVPQMLNLELTGAIGFSKGCYPGQEIVARSQYRGQVKRRLYRFSSGLSALVGAPVLGPDGSEAGTVVNIAANYHGGYELLAVIATEFADARLSLAPDGAALERMPLPYGIP